MPVEGLPEGDQGIQQSVLSDANLKTFSYRTNLGWDYLFAETITAVLPESLIGPGPELLFEPMDIQPLNAAAIIISAQSFKFFMEFPF